MDTLVREKIPTEHAGKNAEWLGTVAGGFRALFYKSRSTPNGEQEGISLILGWVSLGQVIRFDMFKVVADGTIMWHIHRNPLPALADKPFRLNELGSDVVIMADPLDMLCQFFERPELIREQFRLAFEVAGEDGSVYLNAVNDDDFIEIAEQMRERMAA